MWFVTLIAAMVAVEARRVFDPFMLEGHTMWYCWRCQGWGEYPHGPECYACNGQGFRAKRRWFLR
jgi:DnaJ-class molecular chaperone